MEMCQSPQELAAVAQVAAQRVVGLGEAVPVLVPAAAPGRGEAERAVAQVVAAVGHQPAPSVAIKSNRTIRSLPDDAGSRVPPF